jgi:hypothetical protein
VSVLSWSATTRRKVEHVRDRIFRGLGTDEPLFEEQLPAGLSYPKPVVSVNWRKPLRIDEITQMAPTPEVRARPGRP